MFKKAFLILISVILFVSCLKKEGVMEQYEYQIDLDAQTIELFLRTNKVVYDVDTASLEACKLDDADCMWNQRLGGDGVLKKDTPYDNLLDKIFKDTILQRVITDLDGDGEAKDTLYLETGTWLYISHLGDGDKLPNDSSYVLARYAGYLVNKRLFDANSGLSFSLSQEASSGGSSSIIGFRNGLRYFEPGVLDTKDVTDEDGNVTQKPFWRNPGSGWIMIPSRSAYGNIYKSPIPPNSVLVFQIASLAIADLPTASTPEGAEWLKVKED